MMHEDDMKLETKSQPQTKNIRTIYVKAENNISKKKGRKREDGEGKRQEWGEEGNGDIICEGDKRAEKHRKAGTD